jgi:ATP-binding cassette subfamily C (CFTR/MRP) protein 1
MSNGFYWQRLYRSITMVRGILVEAVFNKTMQISITALHNSETVSLMSTDVQRIVDGLKYIHEVWANVIQITVATYLLYGQLGYACVAQVSVAIGSSYSNRLCRQCN